MSAPHLPAEIVQLIFDELAGFPIADSRYAWYSLSSPATPSTKLVPLEARADLARARLVNKAFHNCATPMLFQRINARFLARKDSFPLAWAQRLLSISTSSLVNLVNSIEVEVEVDLWSGNARQPQLHYPLLLELQSALPSLVAACRNIHTLSIRGPSSAPRFESFKIDGGEYQLWMGTLHHICAILCLRAGTGKLDTLNIPVSLRYDYTSLLETYFPRRIPDPPTMSCADFAKTIRHVRVEMSDLCVYDGPEAFSVAGLGLGHVPYTVLTGWERYPNWHHEESFLDFMCQARNLESLAIVGAPQSFVHGFSRLTSSPLTGLRELRLNRVRLTETDFVRLPRLCPTLRALELKKVHILDLSWTRALLRLCLLPKLDQFCMVCCTYLTRPTILTDHWFDMPLLPPPDTPRRSLTRYVWDLRALGHLQRHVNEVRAKAGMELYTEQDFPQAKLPPLQGAPLVRETPEAPWW